MTGIGNFVWRGQARFTIATYIVALFLACCAPAYAAKWTPLTNLSPSGSGTMLLLTDGSVMVQGIPFDTWVRLTPSAKGSYADGTWSPLASMSTQRLYFASHVLPNGKVWILGGEYSGPFLAAKRDEYR